MWQVFSLVASILEDVSVSIFLNMHLHLRAQHPANSDPGRQWGCWVPEPTLDP